MGFLPKEGTLPVQVGLPDRCRIGMKLFFLNSSRRVESEYVIGFEFGHWEGGQKKEPWLLYSDQQMHKTNAIVVVFSISTL